MTTEYVLEFKGDAREVYFVESETPITTEEEALAAIKGMLVADVTEVCGIELVSVKEA